MNIIAEMKIVAVAINKGGVGKTTTSKNLATAAAAAGLNVLLLDMDAQENSRKWGTRRKARNPYKILPLVKFITESSLPEELEQAKRAGCELIIIDTPPGRSPEAVAAVEVADLVLILVEADDQDSFDGIPKTARLARASGTPAVGILNKATPHSRVQAETAQLVFEAEKVPMAPVVMHRYKEHRDANPKGLTAQELDPGSVAATEINALWEWLCAQLHLRVSAQVRPGTDAHQPDRAARSTRKAGAHVQAGTSAPMQSNGDSDLAERAAHSE
jgi:chromosome partitioning protein